MRKTNSVLVMGLLATMVPALAMAQDATVEPQAMSDAEAAQQAMPDAAMPLVPPPMTAGNEAMNMPPPDAMYEPGYDPMMDADYGQDWGPDYGWVPYDYGSPYHEAPYGYGYGYQEPMPPAVRYSNAPSRGGAYPPDMGGVYAGGQPSRYGYHAAPPPSTTRGMPYGSDHHQAMIERLDTIIDRLERIEAVLQNRSE